MNAPVIWHDPVVAEIHQIREELLRQYEGNLAAYSEAAVAHCKQLGLKFATSATSDLQAHVPQAME